MIRTIKKRDGRTALFDRMKIFNAVKSAMEEVDNVKEEVALNIANKIAELNQDSIDIEDVQDKVEELLMESSLKDVAKAYIIYRNRRTEIRQANSALNKKLKQIMAGKNIKNDNANIDDHSFNGRKYEATNVIQKAMCDQLYLREDVKKASDNNLLYIHDKQDYVAGEHNCLNIRFDSLLKDGFACRGSDIRGAKSLKTAGQLVPVIAQIGSQNFFGGCASIHLDTDLIPYVKMSFIKHYKEGLKYIDEKENMLSDEDIYIESETAKAFSPKAYKYAVDMLEDEGSQSFEALYHNLNSLESRPGSQVPFSSINFGLETCPEGKLISKWIMNASLNGIGKNHSTPIFPISIFKYKKGVNASKGDPNYDIKKLAIKSLCHRLYPNIINCDWSQNHAIDADSEMASMGCRTLVGKDRFNEKNPYNKQGRGNVCPHTMVLPKLGLKYGIVTGERETPDINGFYKGLDELLRVTEVSLLDRFTHVCEQSPKAANFLYQNNTLMGSEEVRESGNIYDAMKHNTLAFGYIGIAETMRALFGKDHSEDKEVLEFAIEVVKYMYDYVVDASERNNLNMSLYATPAESSCFTIMKKLQEEFGIIPNVLDRDYLTNSHHVPVWRKLSIYEKIDIESKFCKYATGGCITYVELDSNIMNNEKAIEDIIDYAMSKDIPYLAMNFPIDTCEECGYQGDIKYFCPKCGCKKIKRLRRVTGYLSNDYRKFNKGKQSEVHDREKHSRYTDFSKLIDKE